MNAVNLIPRESRSRRQSVSVSPPTLAVVGGLVLVLVAAVLYVAASNTVTTRKGELSQITAGVAGWTAAANSYASFVQAAQHRTQELADVRQLASSRFPWSDLLGQIGGLMPRASALSSLQAATSAAGSASATSGTGSSTPGVQLLGCAASQSVVAQTMVQLRRINGVSDVTLSSSSLSGAAAGASGSSSAAPASGGCPFPVQFQLALTFNPSSALGAPAATTSATAVAPTTAATGTTATTPATTTTPAASQ
jgi:hypothetical protein